MRAGRPSAPACIARRSFCTGTGETSWLYTEAHLDKKLFFLTVCLLSAASCCHSAGGCLVPSAHRKKEVQQDGKREAACTRSWGGQTAFPAADLHLWKLSDELTTSLAPLIRDTAKTVLVGANSMKALGDGKWSDPCPPRSCSLLPPGVWITSLWRSPQCRVAVDQ